MSVIEAVRGLPPAFRQFLVFSGINLIFWQCIVGPVLVLFSRATGMPPSWVGMLLSFLPLSMLLVIFSIPAVAAYGPRKLPVSTWLIRNMMAGLVFLIPPAMVWWRDQAAWYILLFSIPGFSALSVAVGRRRFSNPSAGGFTPVRPAVVGRVNG